MPLTESYQQIPFHSSIAEMVTFDFITGAD